MKNYRYEGKRVNVTAPVALSAGDPFVVGKIACVATNDAESGAATVGAREGVFNLSVKGHDGTNDDAVAPGDALYCDNSALVGVRLTTHTADVLFGYALGSVSAGATTKIDVLLA